MRSGNWEQKLDIIRGKNLVNGATQKDVNKLFEYIDKIEDELDECDLDDFFGTEGWRHRFGISDD
jgi:hypothetical protein